MNKNIIASVTILMIFIMVIPCLSGRAFEASKETWIDDNTAEYNGHYYKIIKESRNSWDQANQKCNNMGGHLVTITSQNEQNFIERLNSSNTRLWIGGYRDSYDNWYWVTGEQWNYSNWESGEPSGGSEDKAAIWPQKWNDMTSGNLGEQNGFICEWDDYNSFANSSYDPSDYSEIKKEYNGHSYQIVIQDDISWSEAKQKCINMGGHLVTITSQEEQSFIENLNYDNERLWIGGYKDSSDWYWVTGEQWNYSNWGSGEPSGGGEDKAAVWPQKWNDMTDDNRWEQNGFICEWDNGQSIISSTPTPVPTQTVTPVPTSAPIVTSTPKPTQVPTNKNTKISSKKATLYVGAIVQLELLDANGTVEWSSSKKSVATVKNGVVVGIKKGKATITATDSGTGKKYKCKVTVKNTSISEKSASIKIGESQKLKVIGTDVVKWTSSNKKVATVSDGTVKGIGEGKTTITALGENGVKHKCTVNVKNEDETSDKTKKNFEKIAKYIKKNGTYDKSTGDYCLYDMDLGYDYTDLRYAFQWKYNPKANEIVFTLGHIYELSDELSGMVQFKYSLDNLSKCKYSIVYLLNGNTVINGQGTYKLKGFKNIYSTDYTVSLDKKYVNEIAKEYVERHINLLGYGTEIMFLKKLSISFKDLGYLKWNPTL